MGSSTAERVAILLLAPFVSGAEHQTLALCRYLSRRCSVTLLVNDELAALLAHDAFLSRYAAGLDVHSLGAAFPAAAARTLGGAALRARLYPAIQLRLWRRLRALKPSVLHLVLAPSFFAYAPLFHVLRLPTVLTLSGEMRYARYFYGAAKRRAVRYATGHADALVVCSDDEMENLRRVVPGAITKAAVVDNFTDVARFAPAAHKEPLVAFAARLHPEKGALLFLEAAARVHAARPETRFVLMGRGELETDVARRLGSLGLADVVERGFTTDLAPVFARSSVFVSCQQYENLGSSSLLEAMASGNAVVATDVGHTFQIVDDAVGTRVPPRADALAEAILALLSDPQRCLALGQAARNRVAERYGPERYVDALLGVYARARAARWDQSTRKSSCSAGMP